MDQIGSWLNSTFMMLKFQEMVNWWNGKLTKCQVGYKASRSNNLSPVLWPVLEMFMIVDFTIINYAPVWSVSFDRMIVILTMTS
jgi:hypothetical protein